MKWLQTPVIRKLDLDLRDENTEHLNPWAIGIYVIILPLSIVLDIG